MLEAVKSAIAPTCSITGSAPLISLGQWVCLTSMTLYVPIRACMRARHMTGGVTGVRACMDVRHVSNGLGKH